jgi:hypothetical protein
MLHIAIPFLPVGFTHMLISDRLGLLSVKGSINEHRSYSSNYGSGGIRISLFRFRI